MFDLAEYIRKLVAEERMTQGQFAARVGCKQTLVSAWIARRVIPGDDKLRTLAEIGKRPSDFLLIQVGLNAMEAKGINLGRLSDPSIWVARREVEKQAGPACELIDMAPTGTDGNPFAPAPPPVRHKPQPLSKTKRPLIFQEETKPKGKGHK